MGAVDLDLHLTRVLALGAALPAASVGLADAIGCAAASDVLAPMDLPPFDNAAMDGYAVRLAEAEAGAPLTVVGEGAAGTGIPPALQAGEAARVMTGAPVPGGADTVVPVESTDRGVPRVRFERLPKAGANIRRAGEELATGAVAIAAGTPLTPARLALIASLGFGSVLAHRRPVVSVLATGTELTAPGERLSPGSIYESNGQMLALILAQQGADVRVLPHIPDDPRAALQTLRAAARDSDLIVTAGGISAGDFEVVKETLLPTATVEFGPVAISPGRPQGWGAVDGTAIVCLPGNPGSAFVTCHLFAAPLVRRMLGWAHPRPPWLPAAAAQDITAPAGRTRITFGLTGPDGVRPAGTSHTLSALTAADCLIRIDADISAGAPVRILPIG